MSETREPMEIALREAKAAAARGEVPIGACLVSPEGDIIASDGNRTIEARDPTAHAEMLVIREGARLLDNERLMGCKLYVTLEPCAMCAGAISFARVEELIFAAEDPKGGGVIHGGQFFDQPTCHHRPKVTRDHRAEEAGEMLREFFKARRNGNAKTRMGL
ncbi:MAG: nucleoside deaminase [Alphaproteobacteria bacterium]|nr:MAG: nucleoside deaminase [Alphaproteobacteria bacterium]